MNDEVRLRVSLPVDNQGMLGRECPSCNKYFNIKPGTGINDISTTICPFQQEKLHTGLF